MFYNLHEKKKSSKALNMHALLTCEEKQS